MILYPVKILLFAREGAQNPELNTILAKLPAKGLFWNPFGWFLGTFS
jgi:hypothetical protein